MNRGDSNLECSIGCAPYMFILFFMAFTLLLLKLAGAIDWSWWVVLLPAAVHVTGILLKLILERRK